MRGRLQKKLGKRRLNKLVDASIRYLVLDLEATCWQNSPYNKDMETIEIGAVMLESPQGPVVSEFDTFIKPVIVPNLSEFCTSLTSIQQADVDTAETFATAFPRFLEWVGAEPCVLCTWGDFDSRQLQKDCKRHQLEFPKGFVPHINIKRVFAKTMGQYSMGMAQALEYLKIPLEGRHHRGIDDARNIAKIAMLLFPQVLSKSANPLPEARNHE